MRAPALRGSARSGARQPLAVRGLGRPVGRFVLRSHNLAWGAFQVAWLILVVSLLVWFGLIGLRRYAAKKDLEQIQTLMQGRIRLAFGKEAIVSDVRTRPAVP